MNVEQMGVEDIAWGVSLGQQAMIAQAVHQGALEILVIDLGSPKRVGLLPAIDRTDRDAVDQAGIGRLGKSQDLGNRHVGTLSRRRAGSKQQRDRKKHQCSTPSHQGLQAAWK